MIKLNLKRNKNDTSGFTIIEALVAISIFTSSILALLAVTSQSISNTNYAKKKLIAAYLAQEGIEYMRNMRDTYVLYNGTSQAGWTAFNNKLLGASCNAGNGCYFDDSNLVFTNHSQPITGITMTACGANCPALLFNSATSKYGYSSGVSSGYIRKIRIVSQPSANETKISSTVYWTQGSGSFNMVFSESMFNWVE